MNKRYGSPYDRGSADRYYGREYQPHMIDFFKGPGVRIKEDELSQEQLAEYKLGWNQTDDRKDWGAGRYAPEQLNRAQRGQTYSFQGGVPRFVLVQAKVDFTVLGDVDGKSQILELCDYLLKLANAIIL